MLKIENQSHNPATSMWASFHVEPVSFTERALLCDFYLKYLYPSNCLETKIEVTNESVLESLKAVKLDPLATIEIKSPMRNVYKVARAVGRVAYFTGVVSVASAAGTVVHGSYMVCHLSLYVHARVKGNETARQEQWEKAGSYAAAFFVDFSAVVINGASSYLLYTSIAVVPGALFKDFMRLTGVMDKVKLVFLGVIGTAMMAGIGVYVAGGIFPANSIPQLIAYDSRRTAMFTVLSLYNELGLVGPGGGLLPISTADKVEYSTEHRGLNTYYTFSGGSNIYQELIQGGERDFAIHMRKVHAKFAQISLNPDFTNMKTLPQQVITSVENYLESHRSRHQAEDVEWLEKRIRKMRVTKRKIDTLRSMHKSAIELAVNGGFALMFLAALAKKNPFSWDNQPKGYCGSKHLNWHFVNAVAKTNQTIWTGVFEQIDKLQGISAVNSDELARPAAAPAGAPDAVRYKATYNQFKYDVGVAKWKLQKNTKPKLYELFGLSENFTKTQLKRTYYFTYNMALHPDKNPNTSVEADMLFKLAQKINEELIADADRCEQLKNQ